MWVCIYLPKVGFYYFRTKLDCIFLASPLFFSWAQFRNLGSLLGVLWFNSLSIGHSASGNQLLFPLPTPLCKQFGVWNCHQMEEHQLSSACGSLGNSPGLASILQATFKDVKARAGRYSGRKTEREPWAEMRSVS